MTTAAKSDCVQSRDPTGKFIGVAQVRIRMPQRVCNPCLLTALAKGRKEALNLIYRPEWIGVAVGRGGMRRMDRAAARSEFVAIGFGICLFRCFDRSTAAPSR